MLHQITRNRLLVILSLLGLGTAGITGAAEHVPWLASLCGSFSGGCKETTEFTLFALPLWLWGALYYTALAFLLYRLQFLVFWWVAVGFGVELSLLWIMISIHALCVFCLINCLVVVSIVFLSFERLRLWQTLTVSLLAFILATYIIPGENRTLSGEVRRTDPAVVARVKGEIITAAELELPLASELYQLEMQIYTRKKERLDRIITERLLEHEAKRRGVSVQELVREAVPPQQVQVDEDEIERYYQANRARWSDWRDSQEELKARIRDYLRKEKYSESVVAFSRSLADPEEIAVFLDEPQMPSLRIDTTDDPALGPADAPVTVIEFSDYQCPACRKAHEVTGKVRSMYLDRIRWVFKDFPLRQHKQAAKAAEAALCAAEQGRFWEYQDLLFGSQEELSPAKLKQLAGELGLQSDQFGECLDSGEKEELIAKDLETARKAGIHSTPTFVIDGVPTSGALSLEKFQELIDKALQETKQRGTKNRS